MNTSRIEFQERLAENNRLIEYAAAASNNGTCFANQTSWNYLGFGGQEAVDYPGMQHENQLRRAPCDDDKSSSSIMSRFESPASAFYATERYMGFQQYDYPYPKSNSTISNSGESYGGVDSGFSKPDEHFRNSFQTSVKSHFPDDQYYYNTSTSTNQFLIQDRRVGGNPFSQLGFSSAKEIESLRFVTNPVASKTRIRWTQNLHERFVDCINCLGGAEKATPKAILKLMGTEGLTIFHVKSHLQKYRIAKYMPDPSQGGRCENSKNDVSHVDTRTTLQINEALKLQLDVQRRLHEQLEIQKNLQLRIEEQGRQLKRMFDEQQIRTNGSFLKNQETPTTDESSFSHLEDIEVSDIAQGSNNTHFPSKIS